MAATMQHGVTILDLASRQQTQFLPLEETGTAWRSASDGSFFVSGGDSGLIHVFNYADGTAAFERSVKTDSGGATGVSGRHGGPSGDGQTLCLQRRQPRNLGA